MMQVRKILSLIVFMSVLLSCRKEYDQKYAKPDWLVGTVYDQLSKSYQGRKDSTRLFAEAVDTLGLKATLSSGAWTFFVPTDSAVRQYLAQRNISSLLQLPREELNRLVLYHLIKYSYSDYQLLNLNSAVYGNLSQDVLSSYSGQYWRYTTQCTDANELQTSFDGTSYNVVGLTKCVPLLSTEYFTNFVTGDAAQNYNYFYPTSVWGGLNLSSAKIIKKNIACDNGYIHLLDKVVAPLPNLRQIIANNSDYSLFYHILSRFAVYSINTAATAAQPNGGDTNHDGIVENLYNLNYPFAVDVNYELSGSLTTAYTFCPPTNDALSSYLNSTILKFYPNVDSVPLSYFQPLIQSHLAPKVYWPSSINTLTTNSNNESMLFDPNVDVKTKAVASNGFMYGLNKVIVPNYYRSLAGQIVDPSYSVFRKALERTSLLTSNLQYLSNKYTVFVPNNKVLADSGIVYDPVLLTLTHPDPVTKLSVAFSSYDLQQFVQSYIAKGKYTNLSDVKYLTTINNKIIKVLDNNTIQAGGNIEDNDKASLVHVDLPIENGDIYLVSRLLKQPKGNIAYYLYKRFPNFFQLLIDGGLISTNTATNITDYVRYSIGALYSSSNLSTVFAVSDYGVNSVSSGFSTADKEAFCRYLMVSNLNVIPGDFYNSVAFNTIRKDTKLSQVGLTIMAKLRLNTDVTTNRLHLINNTGNQDVTLTDDLIITSNGVIRLIDNDQSIQFESN
jgi:uncharacterized surface protein with fasciclin (FAS1) repeats